MVFASKTASLHNSNAVAPFCTGQFARAHNDKTPRFNDPQRADRECLRAPHCDDLTALIATSIPVAGAATGPRNALYVAHLAAVLFGLTGILGHLIEADASIITFGRATFAFTGLGNTSLGSNDWINLALLGVFCTGLSHDLFVKSLEGLEARTAGMIIALEPVYAILGACGCLVTSRRCTWLLLLD